MTLLCHKGAHRCDTCGERFDTSGDGCLTVFWILIVATTLVISVRMITYRLEAIEQRIGITHGGKR